MENEVKTPKTVEEAKAIIEEVINKVKMYEILVAAIAYSDCKDEVISKLREADNIPQVSAIIERLNAIEVPE